MAGTVKLKRSAVQGKVPNTTDLELGELAVNTYDGKLYIKKDDGTEAIVEIGAGGGGGGGATDLTYTASTRELASSTGTNATLPVAVADGDSGLMIGTDKAKLDDIPTLSVSGRNETLTAASTTTGTVSNTTVGSMSFNTRNRDTDLDPSDSDAEAFISAIAAQSSGDSFTLNGQTYTHDGTPSSYSGSGTYSVEHDEDFGRFGPSGSVTSGSVSTTTYSLSITGSSSPLFDSTYEVTIDGVEYASGVWSVSGTGATATLNADPGIVTGDTLVQANALSFDQAGTTTRLAVASEVLPIALDNLEIERPGSLAKLKLFPGLHEGSYLSNNVFLIDGTTAEPTGADGSSRPSGSVFIGSRVADELDAANITGCTFIGNSAGRGNPANTIAKSLNQNTAVGQYAMEYISGISNGNTAVGHTALQFNSTEGNNFYNTAVGSESLKSTAPNANYNTAVGYFTGASLTSGGNNLLLGNSAGGSASPSGTITTASNRICLGNNSITNAYIKVSWTVTSDGRDKADITDLQEGLEFIKQLRPVTYKWDERDKYLPEDQPDNPDFVMPSVLDMVPDGTHKGTKTEVGFIAQEVEAVEKQFGWAINCDDSLLTSCSDDATRMGLQYERMIPMLVNAIKELSDKNDALEQRLSDAGL